jgi:hypothetical protein
MFRASFYEPFFSAMPLFKYRRFPRRKHFKSATTGVATKSMRNELNRLVHTMSEPANKKVSIFVSPFPMSRTNLALAGVRRGNAVFFLSLHALLGRKGCQSRVVSGPFFAFFL